MLRYAARLWLILAAGALGLWTLVFLLIMVGNILLDRSQSHEMTVGWVAGYFMWGAGQIMKYAVWPITGIVIVAAIIRGVRARHTDTSV